MRPKASKTPRYALESEGDMLYIVIDGAEHPITPYIAQQFGEVMFKSATDLLAKIARNHRDQQKEE